MTGTQIPFLLILACFLKVVTCQNQFFRIRPSDREAVEGENIEFQCHVGNREGDVQWSKDGFLLGFDPNIPGYPRYSMDVNENEGIYNLKIRDVNIQDEGEYQCQVGPASNHTPIRAAAVLRILIPPEYLTVNGFSEIATVEVKLNNTVKLTCQAVGSKPPAQLKWYRNNTELTKESVHTEEKEEKRRFIALSYLSIRPKIEDDGAKYSCEALHRALDKKMRGDIILSVLHPPGQPRIEGYEEGSIVKAGEALTLMCITRGGNPAPELIWYRGNAQIDATYYRTRGQGTRNNLTFTVSAADNGGVYHCEASNGVTREPPVTSVKLSVYYMTSKVRISGPTEARRGETITLQCTTDVSNPRSKISWVVDGSLIEAVEEVTKQTADGWITSSNLTITLTRQEPDTKVFSCFAENSAIPGKVSNIHKLRVIYPPNPPSILGYEEGSPLRVGDLQRFNCVALGGNPPASLRWFKGDREISTPVITSGSGVSSELVIRVHRSDNGAFYRCEANNSAGWKPLSAFVRITVVFPPAFVNISVQPIEPRQGDTVTLTCTSGSSNPMSRITWWREGLYIRDHLEETMSSVYGGIATRSRLTFPVTSSDDGLLFTCQAKSDDVTSTVTKSIVLHVRHKPVFSNVFQTVEIVERLTTTVNLTAGAYPELVAYTWTRNHSILTSDGTVQRVVARGPLLHVQNVSREDGGMYHCQAENEEGSANATVVLNVLYPATVVNMTSAAVVAEGDEAYFECSAVANPMKADMIKWRMKGAAMRESQQSSEDGRSMLTLFNVSKDTAGPVECVAYNGIGEPSVLAALLDVLYRPVVMRGNGASKVVGKLNETSLLKCVIDGKPEVTVLWSFNGTVIQAEDKYEVTTTRATDTKWTTLLTVRNVAEEDFGVYTCAARNSLGYNEKALILTEQRASLSAPTTAVTVKDIAVKIFSLRSWWIPAAGVGGVIVLVSCFLILCCLRKRSNRTTPEGSRQTRHIDITELTADEVCNKLLLSADVKSILLCASEKQHIPLHDFKDHPVFTIEETLKLDNVRTRHITRDEKDQDDKILDDGSGRKESFIEEIQQTLGKTQDDCPDILRNEKRLCLSSTKEAADIGSSPRSVSPESPRYASTPSGSTGSCLSVYHEKTSIRSLSEIDNATVMKLHPIMVLRIDEDAYKFSET